MDKLEELIQQIVELFYSFIQDLSNYIQGFIKAYYEGGDTL